MRARRRSPTCRKRWIAFARSFRAGDIRAMRLTRLFTIATIVLFALIAGLLARIVHTEWRNYRSAQDGLQAMRIAHKAMVAAEKASVERGPANGVLGDAEPPDPAKRQRLREARNITDAALRDLIDTATRERDPRAQGAVRAIRKAQAALVAARSAVDRVADLPKTQRGPEVTGAVHQMFDVIPSIIEGVTIFSRNAEQVYPELSSELLSARFAAELREYAGRLGSEFTAALTESRRLSEAEAQRIRLLRGRLEQLRSLIELSIGGDGTDPRIVEAVRTTKRAYFEQDLNLIQGLELASAEWRPYGMSTAEFAARYVPAMGTIIQLRDALIGVAIESAEASQAAAGRVLAWSAV